MVLRPKPVVRGCCNSILGVPDVSCTHHPGKRCSLLISRFSALLRGLLRRQDPARPSRQGGGSQPQATPAPATTREKTGDEDKARDVRSEYETDRAGSH